MSVVDIRTIISSSTMRMTTGLLSSEGSKASPPGFPGETPIPSRTYSSSERGTTKCRLRKADFGERRLFQLAAVALACRGGVRVPPPLPNYTFIIRHLHPIAGWRSCLLAGPGYHFGYHRAPSTSPLGGFLLPSSTHVNEPRVLMRNQ